MLNANDECGHLLLIIKNVIYTDAGVAQAEDAARSG